MATSLKDVSVYRVERALDNRQMHVDADFGFVTLPCLNAGCVTTTQRRLMTAHDAVCDHKLVRCPYVACDKESIRLTILIHDGFCP